MSSSRSLFLALVSNCLWKVLPNRIRCPGVLALTVGCVLTCFVPPRLLAQSVTWAPVINTLQVTYSYPFLNKPYGVAVGGDFQVYVADTGNSRVVTNLTAIFPAVALSQPSGVAVDFYGNVFIADTANNQVVAYTTNGSQQVFWQTTGAGYFDSPKGVAVDFLDNVYVADTNNYVIRKIDGNGNVSIVAGIGPTSYDSNGNPMGGFLGDNGPATSAQLNLPAGVAVDSNGILYIADTGNNCIRKVDENGIITTVAGNATAGFLGDWGPATSAELSGPTGVALDYQGNLYIADAGNNRVRKVDVNGIITTLAGNGSAGYSGDQGAAAAAQLNHPTGVAVDRTGNIYIADNGNSVIRVVSKSSLTPYSNYVNDGPLDFGPVNVGASSTLTAYLSINTSLALNSVQANGDYSVTSNSCNLNTSLSANTICALQIQFSPTKPGQQWIPLVATDGNLNQYSFGLQGVGVGPALAFTPGVISTVVGGNAGGTCANPTDAVGDGCPATTQQVGIYPADVAVDGAGNLYIADLGNNRIRKVDTSGTITTVAGTGLAGFDGDGGPAVAASLNGPTGIVVDSAGDIYFSDTGNNRVRRVDASSGIITTVVGGGNGCFAQYNIRGDGCAPTSAILNAPMGIALDSAGNLYIADSGNNSIRKVWGSGLIVNVASGLSSPTGVAVGLNGNVYIADSGNGLVRKVALGKISTVVGVSNVAGGCVAEVTPFNDGCIANGSFSPAQIGPAAVKVDSAGNLYIVDAANQRIRRVDAATGIIYTVAGEDYVGYIGDNGPATRASLNHPSGIALDASGNFYVADKLNNSIRKVDVSKSAINNFGPTTTGQLSQPQFLNLGPSGPPTLTLTNIGNAALTLASFSISGEFQTMNVGVVGPPSLLDCVTETPLAVGATCALDIIMAPTQAGNLTGTVTVTDDAFNTPHAGQLSGTGVLPAATFVLVVPTSVVPGVAFPLTVTALDSSNNPVVNYLGKVHFASSDAQAVLPADFTFHRQNYGTAVFANVVLNTAGTQTITVTDTANSSLAGTSNGINVSATAAVKFAVSAPASVTAGSAFNLTVTAKDQSGNTATQYAGTVHFGSIDQTGMPADYTFISADNGAHTFSVTLYNSTVSASGTQTQTIFVTDTLNSTVTGASTGIVVNPAAANHVFWLFPPQWVEAGAGFSLQLRVADVYNNAVVGYRGTVAFTSTDSQAVLPGPYPFTAGDGGQHSFTFSLNTLNGQTITATDTANAMTATTPSITVNAPKATQLQVSGPASVSAGTPFSFTLTALDQSGKTATFYRGTVHFTTGDKGAAIPADYTFTASDGGTRTFTATMATSGSQGIGLTDSANGMLSSYGFMVNPGAPVARIALTAPTSVTAGTLFNLTVSAVDASNNTVQAYRGTVRFTTLSAQIGVFQTDLPVEYTFTASDNGSHTFSLTLRTAGTDSIKAVDMANASLTTTFPITVTAAAATHFAVSEQASTTAGTPISVTVTALDPADCTATYLGTVHFTTTDGQAALPPDYTFLVSDKGTHTFNVTWKTAGGQGLTATDSTNSSVKGISTIKVIAAPASQFLLSAPASVIHGHAISYTLAALDPYNNAAVSYRGTVHFTSSDGSAVLPADYTFTSTDAATHLFSATLINGLNQTVTATDTLNALTSVFAIYVIPPTPILTWSPPAAITYGAMLSGTQLNATANVSGTFVYSPAIGAKLNGGTQTLSAVFTPDDTADFTTASTTVTLVVNQAQPTVTLTGAPASAPYLSTFSVAATTNASTAATITASGVCSTNGNTVTMTSGTGTCTLTANWPADTNYLAATATQSTTASTIAPTVTFTGAPARAPYLATFTVATTTNASTSAVITPTGPCSIANNLVTITGSTGTCTLIASWAADNNYSVATATQTTAAGLIIPVITWAPRGPITYGAPLGSTQLNASANVPGTFTYTPSSGAVLPAGTQTLSATFTPADGKAYATATATMTLTVAPALLTVTAPNLTKLLNAPNPALNGVTYSGFVNGDNASSVGGPPTCTTSATTNSPAGSYPITCSGLTSTNYTINYVPGTLKILYVSGGLCDGDMGHQILQPVNADGTSVWKQGRTIPLKFRVCDANGASIGSLGVITNFALIQIISGTVANVDETVNANVADSGFRFDSSGQQWIFNLSTNGQLAGYTYVYSINLNDGTSVTFQYGLR
jgi:sugar lactone lactonase YvrE